jgi:tetratricopeptide (TPR) repeat protein
MRILLSLLLLAFCSYTQAQSIHLFFADKKYDEVVKKFSEKENDLNGEETYMLGFSHFIGGNDEKAISLYDKAIEKGFTEPAVYFYKGVSFRYLEKNEDALVQFSIACKKDSLNQEYASEKAFTLYRMKRDEEAIAAYTEAKKLPNTYQAPWYMVPHLQLMQGKDDLALQGFYEGLTHISKENNFYAITLIDIAKIENRIKKNYTKAIEAYLLILKENGDNYEACEGLAVLYSKTGKSQLADSLFNLLKLGFEDKKLSENMMKFKQAKIAEYEINGVLLYVYKKFTPPAKMIDVMYTGYLMDKAGNDITRIFQTEQTIQLNDKTPKHILCERAIDGKSRSNYGIGWLSDDISPDSFFELIKAVLEGKLKAAASSTFK